MRERETLKEIDKNGERDAVAEKRGTQRKRVKRKEVKKDI